MVAMRFPLAFVVLKPLAQRLGKYRELEAL